MGQVPRFHGSLRHVMGTKLGEQQHITPVATDARLGLLYHYDCTIRDLTSHIIWQQERAHNYRQALNLDPLGYPHEAFCVLDFVLRLFSERCYFFHFWFHIRLAAIHSGLYLGGSMLLHYIRSGASRPCWVDMSAFAPTDF